VSFIPKTLLITGGAGFIGSCFTGLCAKYGARAIVLDKLTYAGHKANLEWIPKFPHPSSPASGGGDIYSPRLRGEIEGGMDGYELIQGDINDGALVQDLLKKYAPDAVINFAAESHVDNSISGPAPFIETNITGTFRLLDASLSYWKENKNPAFRFVQISTDEVYGSLGPQGAFTETSPIQPNSPYSASKAAADNLVRAWHHTYGLPTLITRCSNNYGPRQFPEKLIPHMISCATSGKPLPVYGDGGNVRDWIHVEDHSAGIWLALTRGTPGEVYNFGGHAEMNNLALVKQLCALLDIQRPRADGKSYVQQISFVADRLGHDRRYAIDDTKAQEQLGFTRNYNDFAKGLAATVEWYLANEAWCQAVSEQKRKSA